MLIVKRPDEGLLGGMWEFPAGKIDPDESLLSSGILDSLGLLRLVAFLEERFGVAVEGDEVIPENFETIDSIKNFIQHKI